MKSALFSMYKNHINMLPPITTIKTRTCILFMMLLITSCGNDERKLEQLRLIKVGMSTDEVIDIMGAPESIQNDIESTTGTEELSSAYYYDYYGINIFSDPIIIWFNSSEQVSQISLPKGVKLSK